MSICLQGDLAKAADSDMEREDAHNILRDVVNEEGGNEEDDDFALAKIMQEQERAFFHARNIYGYGENERDSPDLGLPREGQGDSGDSEQDEEKEGNESEGISESEGEGLAGAEEIDDEELARRLHIQEQINHQHRLMELAGIVPEAEGYTDEEEEGYLTDDSVDPDEMTYEELRALGDAVGVVSRGASVDVINALPCARYVGQGKVEGAAGRVATAGPAARGQDEQCVVCRMEFENGEDVKVLPCKHVFHPECIDQWLTINKACPICTCEVTASKGRAATAAACRKPSKDY